MNTNGQKTCNGCGSRDFTEGKVGNSYAKIMPIGKFFSTGSALIYTFCKDCGGSIFY